MVARTAVARLWREGPPSTSPPPVPLYAVPAFTGQEGRGGQPRRFLPANAPFYTCRTRTLAAAPCHRDHRGPVDHARDVALRRRPDDLPHACAARHCPHIVRPRRFRRSL